MATAARVSLVTNEAKRSKYIPAWKRLPFLHKESNNNDSILTT